MTPVRIASLILSVQLYAFAATVEFAGDRMAVVDGHRTFILGFYAKPDGVELQKLKDSGINLVYADQSTQTLDEIHDAGLWAWVRFGDEIDLSDARENRAKQLRDVVIRFKDHPAMLVWEYPDEALWNVWYRAQLWRQRDEPKQLHARIDEIDNDEEKTTLREELETIRAQWNAGHYAEAEARADALWRKVGEKPPRPGYGLTNAPERAEKMRDGFLAGAEIVHQLDSEHPLWMNHAPRNSIAQLAAFNQAADIAGCDIYPVPRSPGLGHSDIREQTPAAVGAYTDRMQQAAPGKPVWMVLQGFGWKDLGHSDDLRRPTRAETRFMAYNAIVHRARGILYWGANRVEADSQFWADLKSVIRELAGNQFILAAPDADLDVGIELQPTYGSLDRGIVVLPKESAHGIHFIVCNEWTSPLTYSLTGLESIEGHTYRAQASDAQATVENARLTLTIPAQSVQVLSPK